MNQVGKISLGVLGAVVIFGGAYVGVNALMKKPTVETTQKGSSESKNSSHSSEKSSSNVKGTIKVADLVNDPTTSAAVLAQYASDNLPDSSWDSVKKTISSDQPLKLFVVTDESGAAYRYGDTENTPYYRLQGAEGQDVTYYSASDAKLTTVALKSVVNDVNAKHDNNQINKIKTNTTIEVASAASNDVFGQLAGGYVFSSGAGGWHSAMTIATDGSFDGGGKDANADSDSFWKFEGAFGNVEKVSDFEYTMQVSQFSYTPEKKMVKDFNGVKRKQEYIKPWGIAANDSVRVFLPGYPTADLPRLVSGWINSNGMSGKKSTTLEKPVLLIDTEGYKDFGGAPWQQTSKN